MWTNLSWESQCRSCSSVDSLFFHFNCSFISSLYDSISYTVYSILEIFFSFFLSGMGRVVAYFYNSCTFSLKFIWYFCLLCSSLWLSSCVWQKAVCYLSSYEVDFRGGLFHFQDGEPRTISPFCGVSCKIKAIYLFNLFLLFSIMVHMLLYHIKKCYTCCCY